MTDPVSPAEEVAREILERLNERAEKMRESATVRSSFMEEMARDKTRRNRLAEGVPEAEIDYSNGYTWLRPEQTDEWRTGTLLDEAATALRSQQAAHEEEIAGMRKALEPFAEAAENLHDDAHDDDHLWESPAAMSLTAGNLRAARAALTSTKGASS